MVGMRTPRHLPVLTRRRLLGLAGTAAGALLLGRARAGAQPAPAAVSGALVLPALPYAYEALEPHIDAQTMNLHHTRHHGAQVANANRILADLPAFSRLSAEEMLRRLDEAPEAARTGLRNNVGGHANHALFWDTMSPSGGGEPPAALRTALEAAFGSVEQFRTRLSAAAAGVFGSGWAFLVRDTRGALGIVALPNQDSPWLVGSTPLLGVDVWEHAYYLKYQNRRADYIAAWWNVVDWGAVARRAGL